ncbi:hypothetical protein ACG33_02450 [Steroidobacter denitrificans]|uniref:Uncharacterized protein n=1 Tax=Steroidobacter denitrificans TaxID=465721 RepID=A0A127F8X7_STEDE|nr:hypothetical protein ACG33_02450 [Steroidobacter denitrificans]
MAAAARRLSKRSDPLNSQAFIRQYYRGVAEEDLAEHPDERLAAAALAHERFAGIRRPGQTLVRVYNTDPAVPGTEHYTIVETTLEDMPFLVDSLSMVLTQAGLAIHLTVHPVLMVCRDHNGRLVELADTATGASGGVTDTPQAGAGRSGIRLRARSPSSRRVAGRTIRESWQHIRIDRIEDAKQLRELERKIQRTLQDVRLAVTDWKPMRERALNIAGQLEQQSVPVPSGELGEIKAMLEWMADDNFTFLGYREYRLRRGRSEDLLEPLPQTGLGILRARPGVKLTATPLRGELRKSAREAELLIVTKANALSTVHRASRLDYVGLKTFDSAGRVTGERRFLGLFTSTLYRSSPRDIPLLRHKIERILNHFALDPASHDGKAVAYVLETYPRDELFQAGIASLTRTVRGIVNLYERQQVRVFLRRDTFNRFYSALILVPRDRYDTQVRERMETLIKEHLHATSIESQVRLSESALARVHMIIRLPDKGVPRIDADALEKLIERTVRTWTDELDDALIDKHGEIRGRQLATSFRSAFPAAYEEDVPVALAVDDIMQVNEVIVDPELVPMRMTADPRPDAPRSIIHLRLFCSNEQIPLSQTLPILENMGFFVLSERPYLISVPGAQPIWLQDVEMQRRDGRPFDMARPTKTSVTSTLAKAEAPDHRVTEAFSAVRNGLVENDGFNRLVVITDLNWRQASVLRAYCRFVLQTGTSFSQAYMEQVLCANAPIARLLWEIFAAQFDPALPMPQRRRIIARLQRELAQRLDGVSSLDEDRILRRFAGAIQATLRTNYFQFDAQGRHKPWLALKLDSRNIPELPQPHPAFEIFVYSPRVEGVHLRMGLVARGGIRWSDRREDFRTEVLGLMKAQNVKNTLIVPVGAKGGFVPKRIPASASREESQREGIECYRMFIRALLDVTDNILDGRIVPPAQLVRRDGDDPYLVVAADKGTASFSDIANGISAEYGFWLGDAFASGGSVGYDHKRMGITARGGWECVKRHFREIGIDVQSQPFTAIGIGDMAGDVFGNGMLRSPHTRLQAAFNHLHIFIDPDPDPAVSFAERKRLFRLPRSSWEDYDPKLISKGGGVFSRNAKSIQLSAEAQAMLGVQQDTFSPPELIRAILSMPADLLWNGGIGTYVKAAGENNADVGDRANDAVRVDGADLRCRIVGEGGNLGFTQRGRIEYAQAGGRINTDFVDNSAGVDCSDHEVNIKILLNNLPARIMTLSRRNKLLTDMTDEVAALVLRDNYLQSQALSMLESRASKDLLEHEHTIRALETSGLLNRSLEFLPSTEEIGERRKTGRGLTRPELAILLSYAKMALYSLLIDSDVPEDPYLAHELDRYFPALMQRRLQTHLGKHRLRREIIATATTNSMVNRMGATFARRAQEDTGADAATVVRAYAIAREALDMRKTWGQIEALDTRVDAATQYEMMFETTQLLQFCTYWLIHQHAHRLDIEQQVSRLHDGLAALDVILPRVLSGIDQADFEARYARYREAKAPDILGRRIAILAALRSGPDLVEIAQQARLPVESAAIAYFGVGTALSLDWIRQQIETLDVDGHWQAIARSTLRNDIYNLQRTLCMQVLKHSRKGTPRQALAAWLAGHQQTIEYLHRTLADMRTLPAMDFATLSVALQAVRRTAEG